MWRQLSTQKWLSVKYHPLQAPVNEKMVKITFPPFLMWILYLLTNLAINVQYEVKNKDYILTNVSPAPPPLAGWERNLKGWANNKISRWSCHKKFRSPLIDSYPPLCWACFYTTSSGLGLVKTILGPSAVARTG